MFKVVAVYVYNLFYYFDGLTYAIQFLLANINYLFSLTAK